MGTAVTCTAWPATIVLLAASTVVCQVAAIEWASLAGAREDKVVGDAVAEALEHKVVILPIYAVNCMIESSVPF